MSYASTWQGWLYVAFILDVYSRMIVGWQLADHLRTDLVLDEQLRLLQHAGVATTG